jgi:topoisomerase-4 subunit B
MANDLLSGQTPSNYDASSIEVLEDMEHVRLRPGMYIGGKDDRALHHMVAEIVDNSMDEAVAGHATWIEVELHANGHVTVRDNGRGIPVGMHPKLPNKSALEVIFCTLNAGGKFSGDSYQTSGGLHGVGSSVVNALSDHLRVEVAINKELFMMEFSRGVPQAPLAKIGAAPNRRGTAVTFHPDPEIFGSLELKPARLFKMARSKAYLFSGVEIRWKTKRWPVPRPILTNRSREPLISLISSTFLARLNGRSTGRQRATVSSNHTVTPCPRPKAARMNRVFGPPS